MLKNDNKKAIDYLKSEKALTIFELIELLSFFNILGEINGHKIMIKDKKISAVEIMSFAEQMRTELVKDGKMYSLFPDHPDITKKVVIHPPGPPWD